MRQGLYFARMEILSPGMYAALNVLRRLGPHTADATAGFARMPERNRRVNVTLNTLRALQRRKLIRLTGVQADGIANREWAITAAGRRALAKVGE